MSKKIIAILGVAVLAMTTVSAFAADNGPATMTLDFNGKDKKVTEFKHAEHQKRAGKCTECHHKEKEGEAMKACKDCHKDKKGDAPAIKDAYHKNCKDCHTKEKKGPTKCDGCHGK